LDTGSYPTGIAITDAELAALRLQKDAFHGEWNYTLRPRTVANDWVI
jgi:Rhodopirellula transposase DDE domain